MSVVDVKAIWLTSSENVPHCSADSGRHNWFGPLVAGRDVYAGAAYASHAAVTLRFCGICNLIQILDVDA